MTPDCDDHAFVIKLYYDEGRQLRGHITHAYSQRRRPIHRPEDVLTFLEPYLAAMGVRLRPKSRLVLWLSRFGTPPPTESAPPEPTPPETAPPEPDR